MSPTLLLSAGKLLVKSRKAQLAFVGLQFAYIAYKMVQERNKKKHSKLQKRNAAPTTTSR